MTIVPSRNDRKFIPYPLGYDLEFEKCLPYTEVQEGVPWFAGPLPKRAFSDDAHDPGGETAEGIIKVEFDKKLRQWGLPIKDILLITKDEERTIYYTDYWLPFGPKCPPGVNLEFFDMDVNGGQSRAVKTLQRALGGISVDGAWGDETQDALTQLMERGGQSILALIERYKERREAFYEGLPTFRYFGKDWIRRSEEIEKEAEAIEKNETSPVKKSGPVLASQPVVKHEVATSPMAQSQPSHLIGALAHIEDDLKSMKRLADLYWK